MQETEKISHKVEINLKMQSHKIISGARLETSSSPKALIVTCVFPPEPVVAAGLMRDLALGLTESGVKVTVLCPAPSRPAGFSMPAIDDTQWPFKVERIKTFLYPQSKVWGRYRESRSLGKAASRYIRQNKDKFDFVYAAPWPLAGKITVAKSLVKAGLPYVMPVQDAYPESLLAKLPKIGLLQKLVKAVFLPWDIYGDKKAYKIHTISPALAKYLAETRGLPEEHFFVVRNWQNEEEFTAHRKAHPLQLKASEEPFIFMYLGNVGPLAGLEMAIEAFEKAEIENGKLIIAGAGSAKNSLMEKVKKEGLRNIEFMEVPAGAVQATQDLADVMVLPVKKGFARTSIPSKLPAYLFSEKPVLASVDFDSDTATSIIASGGGWVVEPENSDALASQMRNCVEIPREALIEMGRKGYAYAIENLSKKTNCQRLVNLCLEAMAASGAESKIKSK